MRGFEPILRRLLDVTTDLVFVPEQQVALVESIVYIGPVSRYNRRKSPTLLAFRDLLLRNLDITPQPARCFYIERPVAEQRSLHSAAEARAVLEQAGFETMHPATLPFNDQVTLFSQASQIVGTVGAGLANILFAPTSCRVTMIDNGPADYFPWDLAALAGQPFTWMFTGPVSFHSQQLESTRYSVDLDGFHL